MTRPKTTSHVRIGIISDTHGWLSPSVGSVFRDVDVIIHAGDMDDPEVLADLRKLAPVIAVRGNMDHGAWSEDLPPVELVELGRHVFYVIHDLHRLDLAPEAAGIDVVVHGHTHRPDSRRRDGVLYLNPGSASYPRAGTPSGVYLVDVRGNGLEIRHIDLDEWGNGT